MTLSMLPTRRSLLVSTAVLAGTFGLAACSDYSPTGPASSQRTSNGASAYQTMAGADGGMAIKDSQEHFNEKFEFTPVTFPDGTEGTIRAGSKKNNNSQFTQCGYFDLADAFLGDFGSGEFASKDAPAVKQFCLDHYGDRASS